jgi:hypothetical protein
MSALDGLTLEQLIAKRQELLNYMAELRRPKLTPNVLADGSLEQAGMSGEKVKQESEAKFGFTLD